jgi:hypothetical protein
VFALNNDTEGFQPMEPRVRVSAPGRREARNAGLEGQANLERGIICATSFS